MIIFRFVLIKYANRGLIQDQGKSPLLLEILYLTVTSSLMAVFIIVSFIHAVRKHDDDEYDVIEIGTRTFLRFGMVSVFLVIIFTMFLSIEYKKRKGSLKVPNVQRNILTFNQSFVTFTNCVLLNWFILLLRINANNQWFSVFKTRQIASIIFMIEMMFLFFFIPLLAIANLKTVMPQLFNDRKERKIEFYCNIRFSVPREQKFLPYKKFKGDARFGSELKFVKMNKVTERLNLNCSRLTSVEI